MIEIRILAIVGVFMKRIVFWSSLLLTTAMVFALDPQESTAGQSDLNAVTESMGHGHHHEMGPHMHMSALRDPQPGDPEKAQHVVEQVRRELEKYRDYKVALSEGFRIFLPNVPQKMYHFTNYQFASLASQRFDPTK